jgi:hypothetical protein
VSLRGTDPLGANGACLVDVTYVMMSGVLTARGLSLRVHLVWWWCDDSLFVHNFGGV